MPTMTLYAVDANRLSSFSEALDRVVAAGDLAAWARVAGDLQAAESCVPRLHAPRGAPLVTCERDKPAEGYIDPDVLPDPRAAELRLVLRRLAVLAATHTLRGSFSRFAHHMICLYREGTPGQQLLKEPAQRAVYDYLVGKVFERAHSLPAALWFLKNEDARYAYLAPDSVRELFQSEVEACFIRNLAELYRSLKDPIWDELASDLTRLYHFLGICDAEGRAVYYEEFYT